MVANRLKGTACYACGSIDESKTTAHIWRKEISEFLWKHDIGVFNPCDKPTGPPEDENFVDYVNSIKESGNFDRANEVMYPVIKADLHMVDLSNFVIAAIDKDIHLCGSYCEISYSTLEKKPVIIWCPQGKAAVPNWLFGFGLRHEMFFETLEEVKNYILHICYDEQVDDLGRWRFIDYDKVFGRKS